MSCVLTAQSKSFDVIKKYITFTLKILQGERDMYGRLSSSTR
jgi:hypothetical protein